MNTQTMLLFIPVTDKYTTDIRTWPSKNQATQTECLSFEGLNMSELKHLYLVYIKTLFAIHCVHI